MNRYNHKHHLSPRGYLYRVLFMLAAIAILVLFMPKGRISTYHYQKGEPWDEEAFIAQDSFPILKSEEQILREQDSLRQFYEPYFRLETTILDEQLSLLRQDFEAHAGQGIPRYFLPHFEEKLARVYQTGILSGETPALFMENIPERVRVYHGNEADVRLYSSLYTEKTACEYMLGEEDSVRYNHSHLGSLDLVKYIVPNLVYDAEKSLWQRQEVDGRLVKTKGVVLQGQKVVDRGQIVDDDVMGILQSWETHQREHKLSTQELMLRMGGRVLYATILVVLLFIYFQQFRSDYLESLRTVLLIMTLSLLFPIITYAIEGHSWGSVYIVPYCILPIMLRISLDSRSAFICHVVSILASAIVVSQPFTFIVTELVAGLVAIYSLRELSQRSDLFQTAVWVTLSTMLTYFCMELMRGNIESLQEFSSWPFIFLVMAGVLSMLAYLLLIPLERIFGFTSIVTLIELQNVNNPLLRRLSEQASGTFNHSMQVANLAAEVANKLGAKAQLVRTGALYHDIGKIENAVFFTENQNGQNAGSAVSVSPHDGLPYEKSAQIIIQHVEKGLRLADKYKLPKVVKDFISTHHGKSLTRFFYAKAMEKKSPLPAASMGENLRPSSSISVSEALPQRGSGEEAIDSTPFRYPGPKPQTLEQAILMMADAVEAASRSLPEYTEESIKALVDKIIDAQKSDGSFDECAITFREITEAKEVFCQRLRTIYHTRIQYPE